MVIIRFDPGVRRRWYLALVFFGGLLLVRGFWELSADAVPASTEGPAPLREVQAADGAVILTFNVAWGDLITRPLLERLAAFNVQATFFLTGPWAEEHPELVARMVQDGHDVGSLGYRTVNLPAADPEHIRNEIEASLEAIQAAGAPRPRFFRPPGGAYHETVLETAAELGLQTVLWSVNSQDWLRPDPDVIVETVIENVRDGSIVLLHADNRNEQTLTAIDRLIRELERQDRHMLPLSTVLDGIAEERSLPGR